MITIKGFLNPHRRYFTRDDYREAEEHALDALAEAFAVEMKKKLKVKLALGWGGWDDTEDPELVDILRCKLEDHVRRGSGQYVDIANLAAMLWNLEVGEPRKEGGGNVVENI